MGELPPVPALPRADIEEVVRTTAELWLGTEGFRILMTGATGFFGRWMIESLVAANERFGLGLTVTVLSRDPTRFLRLAPHLSRYSNLRWLQGKVTELNRSMLSVQRCDLVIHMATEADMTFTLTDPSSAIETIVEGTRRALSVAAELGARRFLFTSSGAVYGPQAQEVAAVSETSAWTGAAGRTDGYAIGGEAKRQAELLCTQNQWGGLETIIARGFTFAGPGLPLDGKFAFGNFLADALAGRAIIVTGDGTPIRSYLYSSDLAIWLWTILFRGVPGRAYNVGSEEPVSLGALADMIQRVVGGGKVEIRRQKAIGQPLDRYLPSTERARLELNLKETVSLSEAIRRTAAWHRGREGSA